MLVIDATARPGVSAEALEHGVDEVLDDFRTTGPTSGDLARVLAQTETDFVASMQSAGDRAEQLSRFATYFGEPQLLNEQLSHYRAVTLDRVRRMAAERLGPDNRTRLIYVPRLTDGGTAS